MTYMQRTTIITYTPIQSDAQGVRPRAGPKIATVAAAGWGKFYPKGKSARPGNPKGPKDDKIGDSVDGVSLGGPLQTLLIPAAIFAVFSLMNLGRSDAQVPSLPTPLPACLLAPI